ncbi:hypothetical protein SASPL_124262 [Salvia splendens]|uniref:BED-type domain-containing protein n=1 Tax=Salvia splendens TaxID=180675 RepID=A0A8X8XSQ3_SALSN|nr:hypothetical protein SASPL_124262 [Salvia splendens]
MEITEEAVIVNSSRLKSVVWNDFDRVKRGETFAAICRHCKRILSGSSTSGTSHLRNHLIRCRRRSNHDISQLLTRGKRKQTTLAITSYSYNQSAMKNEMVTVASTSFEQGVKVRNMGPGSLNFDQRRSQLDLARMIIMHGYPLGMVEDVGFKTFLQNLQPLFDFVTVNGIEADCIEIYKREKQRVYEELDKLPGKVSLSAERWATNGGSEYLCLIAHYIDDSWELKKKIMNFLSVDPSQAEDMLSELIMASLRNWDIDRKCFSLTIDNRLTYDKIVCRIRDQLCQHRFLMCEGQLFDVRCAASTVKLLVQDVLETSREITNKVREAIHAPECIDIVSNCMKALYSGHAIYSPLAAHGQNSSSESNGGVVKDRLSGFDRYLHETSVSQNTKSDLDKYLEEPLFPRSADFSILNWWKVHEPRYPVLSMMARNILGIPISKVALESLFDTGDRALDHSWGAEKSDTLQALMCSQDWMRNEVEDPKPPVFALRSDAN